MFCPHSQEEIINETIAGHFGGDYDDGDAIAFENCVVKMFPSTQKAGVFKFLRLEKRRGLDTNSLV